MHALHKMELQANKYKEYPTAHTFKTRLQIMVPHIQICMPYNSSSLLLLVLSYHFWFVVLVLDIIIFFSLKTFFAISLLCVLNYIYKYIYIYIYIYIF